MRKMYNYFDIHNYCMLKNKIEINIIIKQKYTIIKESDSENSWCKI